MAGATAEDALATPSTAHHEAGHAIVAFATGAKIEELRIAAPACLRADKTGLSAIERIAVSAAGPLAEGMYYRRTRFLSPDQESEYFARTAGDTGGGCDECQMARWAQRAALIWADTQPTDYLRAGQQLAYEILDGCRGIVATLANMLVAKPVLAGDEVEQFLSRFRERGFAREANFAE